MKDKVLNRSKAFNVLQLLDFVVSRMDDHYRCRLIDIANNRMDVSRTSRFVASQCSINLESIRQVENDLFEVPSEKTPRLTYCVDMSVGCCGCPVGTTGGPCKHQSAVLLAFKLPSWNFLPTTANDAGHRQLLYIVATGDTTVSAEWFASLVQGGTDTTDGGVAPLLTTAADEETATATASADVADDNEPDDANTSADEELIDHLKRSMVKIEELHRSDPVTYGPAITSFCHQTDIASDSALLSALHCFGKYTGAAPASTSRRHMRSLKHIGVQPTAVARRKMAVGGRKRCHLGRPPRSAFAPEHGYSVQQGGDRRHVLPKRRAPHSLAAAVSNVEASARTHSAK